MKKTKIMCNRSQQFHKVYMNIATEIASLSRCNRAKVGAILVKDGNIISFGYNGTISGFDNNCECDGETVDTVVHAEMNAMLKSKVDITNSDLYVTLSPCTQCAKMVKQAGIRKVYFKELYRDTSPLEKFKLDYEQIV